MRVHPAPPMTRHHHTITILYNNNKNLRRLPHIFEKVLELPFHSDCHVAVSETPSHFKFSIDTQNIDGEIWTDIVQIYPGVTKVVVRGGGLVVGGELDVDMWRFRLPVYTRPEMTTVEYGEGGLVVTVPKEEREGTGSRFCLI